MTDKLLAMNAYLKDLDYPKINILSTEDIADIFSKTNREFLVTWLFSKMDDTYAILLQNSTKQEKADLVHESGFCPKSQAMDFICGNLDIEEQLRILYRMFRLIRDVRSVKTAETILKKRSVEETLQFANSEELNLFPGYGPRKTISDKRRKDKIAEYKQEIEELTETINTLNAQKRNSPIAIDDHMNAQLETNIKEFETMSSHFNSNIYKITTTNIQQDGHLQLNPNSSKILAKCKDDLSTVHQLISNSNVIKDLEADCELNVKQFDSVQNTSDVLDTIVDAMAEVQYAENDL